MRSDFILFFTKTRLQQLQHAVTCRNSSRNEICNPALLFFANCCCDSGDDRRKVSLIQQTRVWGNSVVRCTREGVMEFYRNETQSPLLMQLSFILSSFFVLTLYSQSVDCGSPHGIRIICTVLQSTWSSQCNCVDDNSKNRIRAMCQTIHIRFNTHNVWKILPHWDIDLTYGVMIS